MVISEELNDLRIRLERIERLLKSVYTGNKEILNIDEAAEYCGLKKSSIYKLCSQHRIPHYKNSGKMLRFRKDELSPWLLRNRVMSDAETEANLYILKSKI